MGLAGVASMILSAVQHFSVQAESVTVMQQVGVLLQTHFTSGRVERRFLEWNAIDSIIINEAVSSCEVFFYMAFILTDKDRLTVVFPRLLPKLAMLEEVYNGMHGMVSQRENSMEHETS